MPSSPAEGAAARSTPSCEPFATRYGDLIRARYPKIPRRVSGYNLDQLLAGEWISCGAIAGRDRRHVRDRARSQSEADPKSRSTGRSSDSVTRIRSLRADHVPEILEFQPIGLEGFEGSIVDGLKRKSAPNLELLPQGRGFLLVEFGSDDPGETDHRARQLIDQLKRTADPPDIRLYTAQRSAPCLEDTRVRSTLSRRRARLPAGMGRMGRRGCRAGETGRLPARYPQTARRI